MKANALLHIEEVAAYISECNLPDNVRANSINFRVFVGYKIYGRKRKYSLYRIKEESLVEKVDTIITMHGIIVDGKKLIDNMNTLEEVKCQKKSEEIKRRQERLAVKRLHGG